MAAAARQTFGLGSHAKQAVESASRSKSLEFFREVARCLPYMVKNYKLEELTSVGELRSNLAKMFRQYEHVQSSEAVDLLIYKGREELEMILMQHKQRHHLIAKYVKNPALETMNKESGQSPFLEAFYKSN